MWMKLSGAVLVIFACTGLGISSVLRLRARLALLETLKRMVSQLRGEILYANAPLATAFGRLGRRGGGKAASFFLAVSEELEQEAGECLETVWKRQAAAHFPEELLHKKEREQLLRLGESLGYLDRDMQEKTIQLYLEGLELSLAALRREEPEKSRLFVGLGILSGLFLTVILL